MTDVDASFDLASTYVQLSPGGTVVRVDAFSWSPSSIWRYLKRFESDGDEGRLAGIIRSDRTWEHWERHVAGDELVVCLSGRCDIVQEIDGSEHRIELRPGLAMVNERGVWHTTDVVEPGEQLFVAAGRRTEYRARGAIA